MTNLLAITLKETKAYFSTPSAYIVGAMFLVLTGVFFVFDVSKPFAEAGVRGLSDWASFFIVFLAPLITMKLLAEEQKLGTLELLLTSPVREWEVVLGKYLASLLMLLAIQSVTLYYVFTLFFRQPGHRTCNQRVHRVGTPWCCSVGNRHVRFVFIRKPNCISCSGDRYIAHIFFH